MSSNPTQGPLASSVTHRIVFSGGNFELKQVKTATATDNRSAEIVKGGNGPIGITFSDDGYSIAMDVHRQNRVPQEVDYVALRNSQETFAYRLQDEPDGTGWMFERVQVVKADISGNNDGNQTMAIELMALDMVPIQPDVVA